MSLKELIIADEVQREILRHLREGMGTTLVAVELRNRIAKTLKHLRMPNNLGPAIRALRVKIEKLPDDYELYGHVIEPIVKNKEVYGYTLLSPEQQKKAPTKKQVACWEKINNYEYGAQLLEYMASRPGAYISSYDLETALHPNRIRLELTMQAARIIIAKSIAGERFYECNVETIKARYGYAQGASYIFTEPRKLQPAAIMESAQTAQAAIKSESGMKIDDLIDTGPFKLTIITKAGRSQIVDGAAQFEPHETTLLAHLANSETWVPYSKLDLKNLAVVQDTVKAINRKLLAENKDWKGIIVANGSWAYRIEQPMTPTAKSDIRQYARLQYQ